MVCYIYFLIYKDKSTQQVAMNFKNCFLSVRNFFGLSLFFAKDLKVAYLFSPPVGILTHLLLFLPLVPPHKGTIFWSSVGTFKHLVNTYKKWLETSENLFVDITD